MTDRWRKWLIRAGMVLIFGTLAAAVVASLAGEPEPPVWTYVGLGAGVVLAALPGLFRRREARDQ